MNMKIDETGAILIENIKTTMACENQKLSENDIDLLTKCYNNEINYEDALKSIKDDISFRMVK